MQKMKTKNQELVSENLKFEHYVEFNTLMLMLLDPLLLNDANIKMLIRMNGLEILATLLFA